MARQLIPLEQAFWSKVDKRGPDECWPWTGKISSKGYARLERLGRNLAASRIAWQLANGRAIPPRLYACHSCDNPACVNPAHIWPGTQLENIADMIAKGRANWSGLAKGPRSRRSIRTHCPHPRVLGCRCLECKRAYDAANRDRKREYDRARYARLHTAI